MQRKQKKNNPQTTSWVVSGLGLLVSTIGARMVKNRVGAGIVGFGLAHVVLGQLDRLRPTVKENS
ncbi:hypothetical protein GM661_11225 [Iocasia frigidifontis]|uniref:Asparagine synthase n=1 Tax=Iocasia fonsfrigidae TaxID=2682810 RepID=A0A8A7KFE3_9FIRM|nr:hypothetical protein D7D81_14120 [Halocella sp. SP3-1]MTI60810.1 hypothetical protein [Bacillota bacterium]QTM00001.1 hypothetical protein GM661_11225 [Iocasia fonsfrigidae]